MPNRIAYRTYGDPDVLTYESYEPGQPGPGQVLVRTAMIGVNPVDWKLIAGMFGPADPAPFPGVPGWASAGTVEAIGPGVDSSWNGLDVVVDSRARVDVTIGSQAGTYQDLLVVDVRQLETKPHGLSWEQAAGIPSSGVAGYSMIAGLRVTAKDTVLVHGAAGGVGSAAAQVALARGARVIGTASPRNHDYLQSLGVTPVDYRQDDLVDAIRDVGTVTASADAVGGAASVAVTSELLGRTRRWVTAWGDEASQAAGIPWVQHPDDELRRSLELASTGKLTVRVDSVLPLREAAAALNRIKTGHTDGKILLLP